METIDNYYQISDRLATSGQPTQEQFKLIAQANYQIVINLALSTSTNAIINEAAIVTDLGMMYVQLPVIWEHPTIENVQMFFTLMESFNSKKVWVHCAKNMRVSCFIYLWQKYILNLSDTQAKYPMNLIWQPTGEWQQLIQQAFVVFN